MRRGQGGRLGRIFFGREEVAGLEGAVWDWRSDLVNKSAENNSLDSNLSGSHRSTRIASDLALQDSHRRASRSQSPNHKHFASLDLEKHAHFSHRRPTSQNFRGSFCGTFPVNSEQNSASLVKQKSLHRW